MNCVRNLIYIGASRRCQIDIFPNPEDAEYVNADVGPEGEYAPWWYVQLADEEVQANRLNTSDSSRTVRGQVDAYLSTLFPGARANAEAISRVSATRLEFKMGSTTDWLRPANVGFGLSYAFPVIVALVTAAVGQVVVIDSPEAHLHPRAQSTMGGILAIFAAAGVQIIVETHSDHILSGIRLSVKRGVLAPNSIALHFFGSLDQKRMNVLSPQIDRGGALDQWPVGFFDQSERDLAMLSGWGDDDAVLPE
jgi:predicted ATPase